MKQKFKEPLIRIIKKEKISTSNAFIIRFFSLILAMLVISIILIFMHYDPINVLNSMIYGAFGKNFLIRETIKLTIPLVIITIGLSLAFKIKLWNIGGEGQILMGGIAATAISFYFGDSLPTAILLLLMGLGSFIVAGIYGAIPAFFKVKFGTNETLLTLMFNYIASQLIVLLQNTVSWQDSTNNYPKIRMLNFYSRLPRVFGVHIGWIIAIILLIAYYIYIKKTKHGYELRVVGDSKKQQNMQV